MSYVRSTPISDPVNECRQCGKEFVDEDLVYDLRIDTPHYGYVHDECLAEFLYEKLEPYPITWRETKELDDIDA